MASLGSIAYRHEQTVRLAAIDRDLLARVAQLAGALKPGNRNHQDRGGPSDQDASVDEGHLDSSDTPRPRHGNGSAESGGRHQNTDNNSADSAPGAGTKRGKTLRLTSDEIAQLVGTEGYYYAVQPNHRSPTFSSNAPAGIVLATDERGGLRTRGFYREAILFPAKEDCVLAGISLAGEQAAMRGYLGLLCGLAAGVLAVALAGGWALTTRALRPISAITIAAAQIAEGDRSRRIDANETESELGGLADLLNVTFARLEATFDQQARFTADAAHELRTPVAVILLHAQGALMTGRLDPERQAAIEACERGAQRLRGLLESLLQLARLDARSHPVQMKRLDLGEVAAEVVDSLRIVAAKRGVTLATDPASAEIRGDAVQLGQVVMNLVDNAIHHGRQNGHVRVMVRREGDDVILEVVDDGPGVAEKHAPHVFDRFYQADEARSGATRRSGLGLAIAKAIVEAHHGIIALQSCEGKGATFSVRMPGVGIRPEKDAGALVNSNA